MELHSHPRYGTVAQVFHWTTAILVLIAFIYGPGGSEQRVYLPSRDFDRQFHETLGLCVFALVVLRVLWRMVDKQPPAPQVRAGRSLRRRPCRARFTCSCSHFR